MAVLGRRLYGLALIVRSHRTTCEHNQKGRNREQPSSQWPPPNTGAGWASAAIGLCAARPETNRFTRTYNTGTIKTASSVAAIIPLNTAVPRARRAAAPAPVAMTSGTTPRMNANDVIRIGLSLWLAASIAAS